MAGEITTTQREMAQALDAALDNAVSIITKNYLERLESCEIVEPTLDDIDIDIASCGHFFKLSRLVIDTKENFLDKLTTIVNVVSSIDCTLATLIQSDGNTVDYYIGIISRNHRKKDRIDVNRRLADAVSFRGALNGNLIGSELHEVGQDEVRALRAQIFERHHACYSSVSGVVALRDQQEKGMETYVQGIENFVDSMKGQKYALLMLADPVASSELQTIQEGYEMLYTQLSAFEKSIVTLNESDTVSLSNSHTSGLTEGITKGITMTQSKSTTKGSFWSASANLGINLGISAGVGFSRGNSKSSSDSWSEARSSSESFQRQQQRSQSVQSGKSMGKSLQLSYENRGVRALLERIDQHLKRLDDCGSFGAFNCAAYAITDTRETALAAASNYNALMRGQNSCVQASHINTWHETRKTERIGRYLACFSHPKFRMNGSKEVIVTPASIISGNELAIQMGLPKKSVPGITVVPMTPFGRNIPASRSQTLALGTLYHMGREEGDAACPQTVELDRESLSMHTFITGSTGSGKSNTIYQILSELLKNNIHFLVIEPAKGEYKNVFGGRKDVAVYGTNPLLTELLRIDPFSFPKKIHIYEHLDRLVEIFNVCWPMYAAMPAILKDAIERSYIKAGWDLRSSKNKYSDRLFPNFIDVLQQIDAVMDRSQYSSDNKGDYKGALNTRLRSLTNGINSLVFTSDEIPAEELFDKNVIIDLSRVGSSETRSLIMGILVMKLQEYRIASCNGMDASLHHVTVLEEAHNLLKKTSITQSAEGTNLLGKSVEMLTNAIAEMRTYGEGFIIADQAPGLLDMAVIRNTNTKIILRLPDFTDRELVGRAAGLNDEQIVELSKLSRGIAAVYQNDWLEPVLCKVKKYSNTAPQFVHQCTEAPEYPDIKGKIISRLVAKDLMHLIDKVDDELITANMPAAAKCRLFDYISAPDSQKFDLAAAVTYELFPQKPLFLHWKQTAIILNSRSILLSSILLPPLQQCQKTIVRSSFIW